MLTLLTTLFWILLGLMVLLLAWIAILLVIPLGDPAPGPNRAKQEKHNAWLWKTLARKKTGWPNSNAEKK